MNLKNYFVFLVFTFFLFAGCASQSKMIDTYELPDTYQCRNMKDVCKEAQDFEANYEKMSAEEQKEFKTLLIEYRNQCNNALEACKQSDPHNKK